MQKKTTFTYYTKKKGETSDRTNDYAKMSKQYETVDVHEPVSLRAKFGARKVQFERNERNRR